MGNLFVVIATILSNILVRNSINKLIRLIAIVMIAIQVLIGIITQSNDLLALIVSGFIIGLTCYIVEEFVMIVIGNIKRNKRKEGTQ